MQLQRVLYQLIACWLDSNGINQVIKSKQTGLLTLMGAFSNANNYFPPIAQRSIQFDANTKADEGGHAAVGNGGCEFDGYSVVWNRKVLQIDNIQLFQREWMFGVVDVFD